MQKYVSRYMGCVIKSLPILIVVVLLGLFCFSDDKKYIIKNNNLTKTVDITSESYKKATRIREKSIETFAGAITGYGPDCLGCGGFSACSPRQDFRNGNIYYNDATYGNLRIIAADRKYPCGTIIRINENNQLGEEIYTIVLDRGGGIGFNKSIQVDLLFESESTTRNFGIKKDINFDVLRLGW